MRENRFAIATAIATFVLLIVGSLVHGTGSSLACPDWPLCHGTLFPKMENGVEFEHTHRLAGAAVGLMTVVMAVLLLRKGHRYRSLGLAAALLVVLQGALGGITVLYKLPRPISIAHLATAMCFFSLTILVAVRTAPSLPAMPPEVAVLRRALGLAWFLVLAQMTLGAMVRHTASGLACLDVPLCDGAIWPAAPPQKLQMLHRFGAVVAGSVAGLVALRVRHLAKDEGWLRRLAFAPVVLVVLQIALGIASVLSLLNLSVITAHLALGAALLGSLALLWALCPAEAPSSHGSLRQDPAAVAS
jgi:heme A synthase